MGSFTKHITDIRTIRNIGVVRNSTNLVPASTSTVYSTITTSPIAPRKTVINQRWPVINLANGYRQGCYSHIKLPETYVPGDITIEVDWSCSSVGNALLNFGLGYGSGTTFSSDAQTTYKGFTIYPSGLVNQKVRERLVYTGTSFVGGEGDEIVALVLRDAVTATDTINGSVYIHSITFLYQINAIGIKI